MTKLKLALTSLLLIMILSGCSRAVITTDTVVSASPPAVNSPSALAAVKKTLAGIPLAKPYLVVEQANVVNQSETRTAGLWYIIAPEADSPDEYAQTAILAVLDLYVLYNNTSTGVILIPSRGVKVNYAEAHFAVDGNGAEGMTGDARAVPGYWHVRVMDDLPYNDLELTILKLWQDKMSDFPSSVSFSSLSYDKKALRQYIAANLGITYEETQVRQLKQTNYELSESFGRHPDYSPVPLTMPHSMAVLFTLAHDSGFSGQDIARINDGFACQDNKRHC